MPGHTDRQAGFTMIEVLLVMALIALVGAFALFVSLDTYRSSSFRSDRNLLVAALQRARAQAMNNICFDDGGATFTCADGKPHGVKILSNQIVVFQGSTYTGRDVAVDAPFKTNVTTVSGASEVVFSQLSGTSTVSTITLTDQSGHSSAISINSEGKIAWTN
jgi:prepilin-type N-terminal cleavage/methylation domain-containing protein